MSKAAKRRQQVAWGKRMRVTRAFAQPQVIGFHHPAAERVGWLALFAVDEAKTAKDAKSRAIRFRLGYLRGDGCQFPRRLPLPDGILGLLQGSCYSRCNAPGYLLPLLRDYLVPPCAGSVRLKIVTVRERVHDRNGTTTSYLLHNYPRTYETNI